mmetsp:Transcript_45674/g.75954  ORF Transcript_45674/g.75954 Transcript_45674/m.75954 type:complete len:217 (-) Transcript_45674:188-838(-)
MAKVFYTPVASIEGEEGEHESPAPVSGMEEYFDRSARECGLNKSCNCCTCRCCGLFVLFVWLIVGWLNSVLSGIMLGQPCSEGPCPEDYESFVCSSVNIGDRYHGQATIVTVPISCDTFEMVYTVSLIQGILQVVVSILGVIGLVKYMSILLTAPMAYPVMNFVLSIAAGALLYGGDSGLELFGFISGSTLATAVFALFVLLFYQNRKIMKETLHR